MKKTRSAAASRGRRSAPGPGSAARDGSTSALHREAPPHRGGHAPPLAWARSSAATESFDHLVGAGEQRRWNLQANGLGGLKVERKREPRWQLKGQVRGLAPCQNAADEGRRPVQDFGSIGAVVLLRHEREWCGGLRK